MSELDQRIQWPAPLKSRLRLSGYRLPMLLMSSMPLYTYNAAVFLKHSYTCDTHKNRTHAPSPGLFDVVEIDSEVKANVALSNARLPSGFRGL